ncbi:MAG: hypothetical protein LBS65_10055, partial [Desulfovibrio sp.]|nr:hypothetical protein [Desulfovibrio sp.]
MKRATKQGRKLCCRQSGFAAAANPRWCRHTIDNTVKLFENFCLATLHNIQIFSACYRRSDDAI